ncbi:hypothetical protein ACH5RR_018307 [Cinchona calisaya]|uniref:FCP1 homology domain-containing protein n=1 Tax=Cinchona calisaya TaxID=153742 RepID=A0ABD2ZR68_9GENT
MPSLRMKTGSTIGCSKEKKGLRICPKSTMISKNSLSISKIVHDAEELETITQHAQDVCSCGETPATPAHVTGANEVFHGESFNGEKLLLQKQYTPFINSTSIRVESTSGTCTSSETIFSPILESIDNHNELCIDHYGGNNSLYVPQLETEDSDDSSKGSCEYQTCSISDFFVSDMIFSGQQVEGNSVYDNSTDTKFFPGYECEESIASFDISEEKMVIPYLKSAVESGNVHGNRSCDDTSISSSDSSLYFAIHQLRSCNQESDLTIYSDVDQAESFDPHMFIRNIPDLPDFASDLRPTTLPKDSKKTKSVTLVLDLDETLVHSTLEHSDDADFTVPVFFNLKEHTVYVKRRPHMQTFLERVSEMFEIVVFTASQSIYAKQLLDILDPDGKLISRRAYRESCIFSDGSYTKDLTVLGVDLAKIVIIDNSPQVFHLQVNNGIPIKSWFDDPSDSALISLLPFLETLVDTDDVRPIIAKRFGNKE